MIYRTQPKTRPTVSAGVAQVGGHMPLMLLRMC